jgi:ABC-type dipeptide/oligopeptide/nickel transport system permease component
MRLTRLAQRAGEALLSLFLISLLIHAALDIAPGDAADTLAGETATAAQLTALRREMGLDAPFLTRYGHYIGGILLRGDWGTSLVSRQPVAPLLRSRVAATATLAVISMILATAVGVVLGGMVAHHSRPWFDTLVLGITAIALAAPSYWIGLLLLRLFAVRLRWVPVIGRNDLSSLALPVVTLCLPLTATIVRLVRAHMLVELGERYVVTARAKGVSPWRLVARHVLRNSLSPIVMMLAVHFGHLLGGVFIVETLFSWPGLGRLIVQGIFDQDHPVVMGAGLLIGALYIACNLLADVAQDRLDPRSEQRAL